MNNNNKDYEEIPFNLEAFKKGESTFDVYGDEIEFGNVNLLDDRITVRYKGESEGFVAHLDDLKIDTKMRRRKKVQSVAEALYSFRYK
jgi:hypothetical protein